MSKPLSLSLLRDAVGGNAAAFRCRSKLEPAGGPDDKVFPPTYAGGVYAVEQRRIRNGDGREDVVPCVLLDSVQSQANRIEEALLDAYDQGRLSFPLLAVDFRFKANGDDQKDGEIRRIGRITALETPHRIADAIFRDSVMPDGAEFRNSAEGKAFEDADIRHATAIYNLCPTALVFGTWDSTGSRGGLGNKFARALVSEIAGINAQFGVRTGSRIDPLQIERCNLYEAKNGGWTADASQAKQERGKPVLFGGGSEKGRPSAVNHGNVTPDVARYSSNDIDRSRPNPDVLKSPGDTTEQGAFKPGGVTISYALQTSVLSLPQLRRLRFPDAKGNRTPERDNAARTVLAALALAGVALARERGCDLRSRCLLIPADGDAHLELVNHGKDVQEFALSSENAIAVYQEAVQAAKDAGLQWSKDPVLLRPTERLVGLVQESRKVAAPEGGQS